MSIDLLKKQINSLKANPGGLTARGKALVVVAESKPLMDEIDATLKGGRKLRDLRLYPLTNDGLLWRFDAIFQLGKDEVGISLPHIQALVSLRTGAVLETDKSF